MFIFVSMEDIFSWVKTLIIPHFYVNNVFVHWWNSVGDNEGKCSQYSLLKWTPL